MKGIRHQFLAGAALSAQQHGGVAACNLENEVANLLHRPRCADDVRRVEALLELALQAQVFVYEAGAFGVGAAAGCDVLGDHGCDDGQEADVRLETCIIHVRRVCAQCANDAVLQQDRDADEGGFRLLCFAARPCAIKE